MEATIGLLITAFLFILGIPVMAALGFGAIIFMILADYPLINVGQVSFTAIDTFPYLAIPLFVLTGELVAHGGILRQLVNLAYALLGTIRGGLGMAVLVASVFFAAICGSNAASAAAFGRLMIPEMAKKYDKNYAAAIVSAGSCMGIVIPPSVILIIYGAIFGVSTSSLFIGAIIPGIVMITCMIIAHLLVCKWKDYDAPHGHFEWSRLVRATWEAKWGLAAPVLILGTIYTGVVTPTESAVIATVYCALVGFFITRKLKLKAIPDILVNSAVISGLIMPIIAMAKILGEPIIVLRLVDNFVSFMLGFTNVPFFLVLLIIAIMLLLGLVLEAIVIVLLAGPFFMPIATHLGFDPVHWGICFITTLTIGYTTPPYGMNLFVVSGVANVPALGVAKKALPLVLGMIVSLAFIYSLPQLTLYLVKLVQ